MTKSPIRLLMISLAATIGFAAGRLVEPTPEAAADTRRAPAREAFKSGGARSEAILKEISATLTRIEERVTSIEKAIPKKP